VPIAAPSRVLRRAAAIAALVALVAGGVMMLRAHRHRAAPRLPPGLLVLRVTDGPGGPPIGSRVLLFDSAGAPVRIGRIDFNGKRQALGSCAIAPGVAGTWDGLVLAYGVAEIPIGADDCEPSPAIPHGRYRIWAWRGIEYEIWKGEVDLTGSARTALVIPLERAWTPHGTLAADLHVHAQGSEDARTPNRLRVMSQVAAGVQVIGLSDHNRSGDLDAEIHELGLDATVASIACNEITGVVAHLGVYPVPVDRRSPRGPLPDDEAVYAATPDQLFDYAEAFPGDPIIQVNHPRFRYAALFDSARWDGTSWPPPFPLRFDAVEILSGHTSFNDAGDRRIDEAIRDFYTLVDHGVVVTALGNSDTHHLNGVRDALSRNYVFVDDPTVARFDEAGFVAAIRAHRVVTTTGPWLDVEVASRDRGATVGPGQLVVADGGAVWVDLELAQASFVAADRIRIVVGGPAGPAVARTLDVPAGERHFRWRGRVDVGAADTWLGVDAGGDTPLPVELTGSYFAEKGHRGATPHALVNPIRVDADGDGRWARRR